MDPLEGKTLEFIVTELVNHFGFEELGKFIKIRCFTNDPSIKSSLKYFIISNDFYFNKFLKCEIILG